MKLTKAGENGEIHQVLNISGFDQAPDGFVQVDDSLDDLALIELHYLKGGELKERLPRPSPNHIWVLASESWRLDLSMLRTSKFYEIDQACRLAIVSGFVSYALGVPHHYPSKVTDQQNLAASVLASYDPENASDWMTPFWSSDASGEWVFRPHTGAQIREVGRDAKSAVLAYQFKNEQLQSAILAATTAEEIQAIAW